VGTAFAPYSASLAYTAQNNPPYRALVPLDKEVKKPKKLLRGTSAAERKETRTMLIQDRSYITYAKLNEQCRRAVDIIERHGEKAPTIDSQKSVLLPIINGYLDQQEQLTRLKARGKEALRDGNRLVKELYLVMRSWFGQLDFLLVGFNPVDFDCDLNRPDSVIGAADRLIDFVRSRMDNTEETDDGVGQASGDTGATTRLEFAAQLLEDMTARRDAAYSAWREAQDYLAEQQELRSSIRETAIEVQHALVAIRKTLRHTLGSSHRDYQKLRLNRNRHEVAESTEQLETVEQLEELDSVDSFDSSGFGENDGIESVPVVVTSAPVAEDKGNGKGKVTGIDPYYSSSNQSNGPAGT